MLLMLFACATVSLGPLYVPSEHSPPPAFEGVFSAQTLDALFTEAVARREAGDYEGAIYRLVWLREHGDTSPAVLYQLGIAYELSEDLATAVTVYDLMLSEGSAKEYPLDAGFRRALCLEELGRYEEAYRQYKALPTNQAFDRHDRYTLDIAVGIAALRSGHEREGRELLETSLMATDGTDEITWMRAKGYIALADWSLDEAAKLPLYGSTRRITKNLNARAEAITASQEAIVKVIALEEPDWILHGLMSLGDAYATLYDDLISAPPPRKLDADEVQVYNEQVRARSAVLLRKAWESYDQGMVVAGKLAIENGTTRELQAKRDAIPLDEAAQ